MSQRNQQIRWGWTGGCRRSATREYCTVRTTGRLNRPPRKNIIMCHPRCLCGVYGWVCVCVSCSTQAAALAKEGEREGLPLDVTSLLDNRDDSVAASAASNSSMVQTTTATTAKAKINQSQPEPQRHQTRNGEPKKTNEYLNATTGHLIGGSGGGGGGCDNSGAASPISRSSTQQTSQDNGGEAEEHNNAAATSNNSSSSSSGSCCGTAASNSNTPMLDKMSRNSDDRTGNEQLGKAPCDVARTTTSDSEAERREPNCRSLQHNGEDEKECEAERVCVAHERGGGVSAGANGGVAGAGIEGGLERIEEKNAAEGLMEGEPTMTVVDVTDLFRTTKGLKCMLSEAYSCVFGRTEQVSNLICVRSERAQK